MNLTNSIISYFSYSDRVKDSYKDSNNKGILERFNEIIGSDVDERLLPKIDNLLTNVLIPRTCEGKFIGLLEERLGLNLFLSSDEIIKRKVINNAHRFYQIKGTKYCLETLLRICNFTDIVINEEFNRYRFDIGEGFDSPNRVFDQNCYGCSNLEIVVETTDVVDAETIKKINSIVEFNKPINVKFTKLTVNDLILTNTKIFMFINSMGDLIFYNEFDPELFIFIDGLGNFVIQGPNSERYTISETGDLIYN